MEFNVSKCVHLPITNKTKPSPHKYSLSGQPLSTVSSHSYLGVKLDSKLTWTNHVTDITSKSSKFLGMIKRTLGPCKPEVKQTAYNMLIRPKLEYSSPIWNPHTFSQVNSLERVQHSAARFVKNDYRRNTNPADLITALGWPTIERRRIIKQATTFYKIINNIIEITILSPSHSHMEYDSTKNHQHKKPKIISRSYYGTPFHHTSSPKLPLKHSAQRKLIHGVGMEKNFHKSLRQLNSKK